VSPLNKKQVDRLRRQPPKSGRSLTFDNQIPGAGERVPGFGVFVTAGGVASFFLPPSADIVGGGAVFDYQEYRNRSSQHILFHEAGWTTGRKCMRQEWLL